MLAFYHKIAKTLERFRLLIYIGFVLSLSACGFVTFFDQTTFNSDQQLLFFILPIWFLSLLGIKLFFLWPQTRPEGKQGFLRRIQTSLQTGFCCLVALLFTLFSVALSYLTLRALSLIYWA